MPHPATNESKSPRERIVTPFDEAKAAQSKLDALDQKRQAIRGELSPAA